MPCVRRHRSCQWCVRRLSASLTSRGRLQAHRSERAARSQACLVARGSVSAVFESLVLTSASAERTVEPDMLEAGSNRKREQVRAVVKEPCPKCKNPELQYYTMQYAMRTAHARFLRRPVLTKVCILTLSGCAPPTRGRPCSTSAPSVGMPFRQIRRICAWRFGWRFLLAVRFWLDRLLLVLRLTWHLPDERRGIESGRSGWSVASRVANDRD